MKKKIVIIEDEENIAQMEGMILNEDYELYFADNGKDGLTLTREVNPAVIILDIMLPKLDGYELCKKIKQNPKTSKIRVIMVTAKNTPSDQKKGHEAGTDEYLMKPFDPLQLLEAVQRQAG
ncbi:response regulator [Candidatus Woesearchaeota archaeon]|nr:response regulator [Candidatus Woesearchaeota archaeon]